MESENTSRPQPYSRLIGCRNRPKPARTPKVRHITTQPTARTSVGVRRASSFIRESASTEKATLQLFNLREVAGGDALSQRLDRFRAREAAPPGEADAPYRRGLGEGHDAHEIVAGGGVHRS